LTDTLAKLIAGLSAKRKLANRECGQQEWLHHGRN
jgi:hypothetical protein